VHHEQSRYFIQTPESRVRWRLLNRVLFSAILMMFPLAAFSSTATSASKLAGTYQSVPASKDDPSIGVSLGSDGSATVTEDMGKGATTLFGHWVDGGSQVTVTFDAGEGKPAQQPMVFEFDHNRMQAVTWNRSEWGKMSPPPMRKATKVKETYWFSTVR
jgi:hypothetical protein